MTVRISWMLTNRMLLHLFPVQCCAVCLIATTCFILSIFAIAWGIWFMCTAFEHTNFQHWNKQSQQHSSSSNRIDRLHSVLFNLCLYSSVTECISICFPGAQFHTVVVVFPFSSSSCFHSNVLSNLTSFKKHLNEHIHESQYLSELRGFGAMKFKFRSIWEECFGCIREEKRMA